MGIDTSEIGIVAAKVMEDLEEMQRNGEVPNDARVVAALVTYEIDSVEDRSSTVGGRCTNDSSVLGLGLIERMRFTMLNPTVE